MADLSFRVVTPRGATPGWLRRWLLAQHPGSPFGRKRRARRARGRRIEARREMPQMVTLNLGQAYGKGKDLSQRLMRSHCADAARYLAPSLGQPWEEPDGFPPDPEEESFSDVLDDYRRLLGKAQADG